MRRPFAERYAILLANGRGAYQPLDLDSMEQRQLAETVRRILQAAGLDGWQASLISAIAPSILYLGIVSLKRAGRAPQDS